MIFGMLNPEKIRHENLTGFFPPHLSDVATLTWEIQKKSFSTVLFIHSYDCLCYFVAIHMCLLNPGPLSSPPLVLEENLCD